MDPLFLALHLTAAALWVGGMFFAHQAQRPAALDLDPPVRLALWVRTFNRFFPWVWAFVIILPLTGYALLFGRFGGMATAPLYVHIMHGLGWVMILIFIKLYFLSFRRLKTAVNAQDFEAGAKHLATIRRFVGINLVIGLIVLLVASAGRMLI